MDRTRSVLLLAMLLSVAAALGGCTGSTDVWPAYGATVTAEERQRILAEFGVTCRPWSETGWDGWELTSRHWQIRTTVRDEYILAYTPLLLEDAYAKYREALATDRGPDAPMRGYLFSDKREWTAFTRQYAPDILSQIDRITAGGYQYKGTYVSFYNGREGTLANAAHEGLHLFWEQTFATPIPSWLNEGLAVQFEGALRRDGRLVVDLSTNLGREANLRYAILHKDTIPLDQLIGLHPGEAISGKRNRWQAYYGEVWALYRFLRDGRRRAYRPALQRIITDCKVGRYPTDSDLQPAAGAATGAAAGVLRQRQAEEAVARFAAYLPVPFEQFEREYWAFAHELAGFPPKA